MSSIKTLKITSIEAKQQALEVITSVYLQEKNWIKVPENEIPDNIGESTKWSWFLATVDGKPAGVIRLAYDPSLEFRPGIRSYFKPECRS